MKKLLLLSFVSFVIFIICFAPEDISMSKAGCIHRTKFCMVHIKKLEDALQLWEQKDNSQLICADETEQPLSLYKDIIDKSDNQQIFKSVICPLTKGKLKKAVYTVKRTGIPQKPFEITCKHHGTLKQTILFPKPQPTVPKVIYYTMAYLCIFGMLFLLKSLFMNKHEFSFVGSFTSIVTFFVTIFFNPGKTINPYDGFGYFILVLYAIGSFTVIYFTFTAYQKSKRFIARHGVNKWLSLSSVLFILISATVFELKNLESNYYRIQVINENTEEINALINQMKKNLQGKKNAIVMPTQNCLIRGNTLIKRGYRIINNFEQLYFFSNNDADQSRKEFQKSKRLFEESEKINKIQKIDNK